MRYGIAEVCKKLTKMVEKSQTEHGYFTDKYHPLPESNGASHGQDGPPPPSQPQATQASTPLQPKPDDDAVPQPRRMQRTQHHQTAQASKRHSAGGRTRLPSLSESTASREALEHEGSGFGSQTRGAMKPKNTSSSQQATVREDQASHQPKKQPQALTRPSTIESAPDQTNNQENERSQQISHLPGQRPITNISEQATTQEPEPQAQAFRSPRQQRPPKDGSTNTLINKPVPRSSADTFLSRPAASGPRSRDGSKKDTSTQSVRRPAIDLEKLRADTFRNIKLPPGQAPGEEEPTERSTDAGAGGTERPGKAGSQPRAGREEIMRETARMETNLQSLAGKKVAKQEPKQE